MLPKILGGGYTYGIFTWFIVHLDIIHWKFIHGDTITRYNNIIHNIIVIHTDITYCVYQR